MPIPLIARHLAQSGAVNFHARVILGLGHRLGPRLAHVTGCGWTECVIEGAQRGDGFILRAFLFLPYSSVISVFENAAAFARSKSRVGSYHPRTCSRVSNLLGTFHDSHPGTTCERSCSPPPTRK
ncbi:hypothetical protein IG631_04521 [Alternaria alternata]|nr:hypothetical protein IG631_04521 [Alternaria alternata]